MATPSINKLSEDVSYLRKDMAVVGALVDRLDTTIDKLTDISNSVSSLLAVHETKLTSQEIISKQLADLVEARRVETDDKIQILHERISSGEREIKEKIDDQYDELMKEFKEMRAESTLQHNTLSDRITTMERWMWTVVRRQTPKWQPPDRCRATPLPPPPNCTLNPSRVNTVENQAFCPFFAHDFTVWAVSIGAGTAFALIIGNEKPGQF